MASAIGQNPCPQKNTGMPCGQGDRPGSLYPQAAGSILTWEFGNEKTKRHRQRRARERETGPPAAKARRRPLSGGPDDEAEAGKHLAQDGSTEAFGKFVFSFVKHLAQDSPEYALFPKQGKWTLKAI